MWLYNNKDDDEIFSAIRVSTTVWMNHSDTWRNSWIATTRGGARRDAEPNWQRLYCNVLLSVLDELQS